MESVTDQQLRAGLHELAAQHQLPELEQVASVIVDGGLLISALVPDVATGRAWASILGLEEVKTSGEGRAWAATWTDERSGWLTTWQVESG